MANRLWCSFIGGHEIPACDFGISEVVTVAEFLKPYHERFFAGDMSNWDFPSIVNLNYSSRNRY